MSPAEYMAIMLRKQKILHWQRVYKLACKHEHIHKQHSGHSIYKCTATTAQTDQACGVCQGNLTLPPHIKFILRLTRKLPITSLSPSCHCPRPALFLHAPATCACAGTCALVEGRPCDGPLQPPGRFHITQRATCASPWGIRCLRQGVVYYDSSHVMLCPARFRRLLLLLRKHCD